MKELARHAGASGVNWNTIFSKLGGHVGGLGGVSRRKKQKAGEGSGLTRKDSNEVGF